VLVLRGIARLFSDRITSPPSISSTEPSKPAVALAIAAAPARNGLATVAGECARALPSLRRLCSGEAAIPLRQHGPTAEVQGSPRLPSLEEVRYGRASNHHVLITALRHKICCMNNFKACSTVAAC